MESSHNGSMSFPTISPSQRDSERDADLERDLVMLLSKLEYFRARLAGKQVAQRSTLALHIFLNMLDELTGFTEQMVKTLDNDQLGKQELIRAGELYITIQEVIKEFTPNAFHSVVSFFGGQPVDLDQRYYSFSEVTRRFLEVVRSFFVLYQGFFRMTSSNAEWIQAYRLFLVDLEPVVTALKC
jgi:hypothetical protein